MTHKKLLRPERQRQIPPHFSWVDHRLIRQHRLRDSDHCAWALYLFLVSVGDAQGLSYYSDASLARALKVDMPGLSAARRQLIGADLIAYQKPLYQVLDLVDAATVRATPSSGSPVRSVADILRQALGGAA
jgi:hypothetical protein